MIVHSMNLQKGRNLTERNYLSMNECTVFEIQNQAVLKYKRIVSSYKHNSILVSCLANISVFRTTTSSFALTETANHQPVWKT